MRYVVAVSGGVDSVVLLDVLSKQAEHELIIAHFDHGIRADSAADARFVEGLARRYGAVFETRREELGRNTSEEHARVRRYVFLRNVAKKYDARLATAHHQDDAIESIAINITRGTGWRGLAVLGDQTIDRPLLTWPKADIHSYALEHKLEWIQDSTNVSDRYLRNRVRKRLSEVSSEKKARLVRLFEAQKDLATHIDEETIRFDVGSRYFMTMVEEPVALELLRSALAASGASLTIPQRRRALLAIKTAGSGSIFQAGSGVSFHFTATDFIVKHP